MENIRHSNIPMRKDTAKHYREIRSILKASDKLKPKKITGNWWLIAMVLLIFIGVCVMFQGCAQAYTNEDAIKTIVGEASNQGYKGMVCVGEVIRHNSTLRGFYGFKAMHHRHEPQYVWKMARKAWYASLNTNYTGGADHFENIGAFGEPYWVKSCKLTFIWKNHKFYKERRN